MCVCLNGAGVCLKGMSVFVWTYVNVCILNAACVFLYGAFECLNSACV